MSARCYRNDVDQVGIGLLGREVRADGDDARDVRILLRLVEAPARDELAPATGALFDVAAEMMEAAHQDATIPASVHGPTGALGPESDAVQRSSLDRQCYDDAGVRRLHLL